MKYIYLLFITSLITFSACKSTKEVANNKLSPGDELLAEALTAHGGALYNAANYQFVFRGNSYTFKNSGDSYEYSVLKTKDGVETYDQMSNSDFSRQVDGQSVSLNEKQKSGYGASLNSVIYFATLPHKLQDPSVNLAIKEKIKIKGIDYRVLEVSFNEEGGGQDHDDIYYYWINQESKLIDYLAYNFTVNKGGVRFRSAYNTRRVNGVIFQDYVNFKAPVGTALEALPGLYEKEELTQLSLIETESVKSL